MPNKGADLLLRGGRVYPVDAARSWAQAVAVRDGTVVAVGTDDDVGELADPSTRVIDLAGRMLVPGFIDAHVHASAAGLERLRCDLSEAHGLDDYLAIVRRHAQASPTAGGWGGPPPGPAPAGGSGGPPPGASTAGGSGGSSPRASTAGGSGGSSPRA